MELKELCERSSLEVKEVLLDYYLSLADKSFEERVKSSFDDYISELWICPKCDEIRKDEDKNYALGDIGEYDEMICTSCRESRGGYFD